MNTTKHTPDDRGSLVRCAAPGCTHVPRTGSDFCGAHVPVATVQWANSFIAKHTPGPWRHTVQGHIQAKREHAVDPHRQNDIDVCRVHDDGIYAGQFYSNARLIASAPDLLAALRKAANDLASLSVVLTGAAQTFADEACAAATAALQKVEQE